MILVIDMIDDNALIAPIEERFVVEALATVIMNFEGNDIDMYDEIVENLLVWVPILLHQKVKFAF